MALIFNEKTSAEIAKLLTHYPNKQAALLPVLHTAQKEFGWISTDVIDLVAKTLDLSPAHVYGVATFYKMFHMGPVGKYRIQLCLTLPCALMGCERILAHLKKRLGIKVGETTPDGKFTLITVECLASCGTGPAIRINETYYENLTESKVDQILEELK